MAIDYGSNNVTTSGNINVSGVVTATSGSFTNLLVNGSSSVTGSGIINHIPYWNSTSNIIADSGQLTWDSTNNRLGIAMSSPTQSLEVSGNIAQKWTGNDQRIAMVYDNNWRMGLNHGAATRTLNIFCTSNDTNGHIIFSTRLSAGSSDTDYGTERMRITSNGVGIGTNSPSATLHVNGSGIIASGLTVSGVFTASTGTITTLSTVPTYLSPSALSGSQGNWSPGAGDVIRISASASGVNISGIVLGTEYTRVLINIGSTYNITLKHEATSATAANRIITSTGGDHIIPPTGATTILYDTVSSRWRIL